MRNRETVTKVGIAKTSHLGDNYQKIDTLINSLVDAKANGATHYILESYYFDSSTEHFIIDTSKNVSDEELKERRINRLKRELKELER